MIVLTRLARWRGPPRRRAWEGRSRRGAASRRWWFVAWRNTAPARFTGGCIVAVLAGGALFLYVQVLCVHGLYLHAGASLTGAAEGGAQVGMLGGSAVSVGMPMGSTTRGPLPGGTVTVIGDAQWPALLGTGAAALLAVRRSSRGPAGVAPGAWRSSP